MLANQVLASASAIFSWAVRQEIVQSNPCSGIERNETKSRDRVLSDAELPRMWSALNSGSPEHAGLKLILLTGQRPGEVAAMRIERVQGGWWTMPGEPDGSGWPGTKNGMTHRVWLPKAAQAILSELVGWCTNRRSRLSQGDEARRRHERRVLLPGHRRPRQPHDLRRTHGSTVTRLGFGREAMNRIQNHREGGIADVYDRHRYDAENQSIMERVASHLLRLATSKNNF